MRETNTCSSSCEKSIMDILHCNTPLYYLLKKKFKNTVTFNIITNSKSLTQSNKTLLQKNESHIEIS